MAATYARGSGGAIDISCGGGNATSAIFTAPPHLASVPAVLFFPFLKILINFVDPPMNNTGAERNRTFNLRSRASTLHKRRFGWGGASSALQNGTIERSSVNDERNGKV